MNKVEKIKYEAIEVELEFCSKTLELLKKVLKENPDKKMVFSKPVGYRKITEVAPFGPYRGTNECRGALFGHEHYKEDAWSTKGLETCFNFEFWFEINKMLSFNKVAPGRLYYSLVENDMKDEEWILTV